MKERNHKAECGNCPYWFFDDDSIYQGNDGEPKEIGVCARYPEPMEGLRRESDNVCGEHPGFLVQIETEDE